MDSRGVSAYQVPQMASSAGGLMGKGGALCWPWGRKRRLIANEAVNGQQHKIQKAAGNHFINVTTEATE